MRWKLMADPFVLLWLRFQTCFLPPWLFLSFLNFMIPLAAHETLKKDPRKTQKGIFPVTFSSEMVKSSAPARRQSEAHLLPSGRGCAFSVISPGDRSAQAASDWPYCPICFIMFISLISSDEFAELSDELSDSDDVDEELDLGGGGGGGACVLLVPFAPF